jgi:hypothetical protein
MHNGNLRKFERPILFSIGDSEEFGVGVIWNLGNNRYTHPQNALCEFAWWWLWGVLRTCCIFRRIFDTKKWPWESHRDVQNDLIYEIIWTSYCCMNLVRLKCLLDLCNCYGSVAVKHLCILPFVLCAFSSWLCT